MTAILNLKIPNLPFLTRNVLEDQNEYPQFDMSGGIQMSVGIHFECKNVKFGFSILCAELCAELMLEMRNKNILNI